MNGLTTLVLGIMLGSVVANPVKTETYNGCSQCYSKNTDSFITCLNDNCKREILSKEVLFDGLSDSIKSDSCGKCIENQGQDYYDCLSLHCSSIIKDKATDLALHSPWKVKKMIPLDLNSCKKCLQTIINHENSASCYYFSCSQELNHGSLLKLSPTPSSNCLSCSSFQGTELHNCLFLFCSQEISTAISKSFQNLKSSPLQCMNYCYTQSSLSSFDYFTCHSELCGSSPTSIEVYHNSLTETTSKCNSCQVLFTGASLKSCQSLYCISDFQANLNQKKLFAVSSELQSKCEACAAFTSEASLNVCVAQNCKAELKPELVRMIESKSLACGFKCEEVYYRQGLDFDKFYGCLQRECDDELSFVYRMWMNRKDLRFGEQRLCEGCFGDGSDRVESFCAFCFRQALVLDLARDRMKVEEERCRLVNSDPDQVIGLVLMGCGEGLIKALKEVVLYDPTVLTASNLSISAINKYLRLFTNQSLSSTSPDQSPRAQTRSQPTLKISDHLTFLSKSQTSNQLLSSCAESILKVHKSSKSNFIESSMSKCQMTKVQSEIYLIANLKSNSLKQQKDFSFLCLINQDLASKNYCNDLKKSFKASANKIDSDCKSNCFKSASYIFDKNYSSCKANCPVISTRNELCDKCWDEYNNGKISKDDYVECMKFYCRAQITELSSSLVSNEKRVSDCGSCSEFDEKSMILECIEYYCKEVTEKVALIINQEEYKQSQTTCSLCSQYFSDQPTFKSCLNQFCREEILNQFTSTQNSNPPSLVLLFVFLFISLMVLLYIKSSPNHSTRPVPSLSSPLIPS